MPETEEKKLETAHEEEEQLEEELKEQAPNVSEEIADLLEIIDEKPAETKEEESTEEEEQASEEEEQEEVVKDEEEEEEEPSEKEDESEEESKDELEEEEESEEEEPPTEDKESLEDINTRLREEINTLARKFVDRPTAPIPAPTPTVVVEGEVKPAELLPVQPVVIPTDISQEKYDEAMTDPKKFAELVNEISAANTLASVNSMQQTMNQQMSERAALNRRVEDFFDEHESLRGQRDYIGFLATDLADTHKDWSVDKIFEELPKVAFEKLGLSADTTTNKQNGSKIKGKKKNKSKFNRPAFNKSSTKSRGGIETLTETQKDISKTLEL